MADTLRSVRLETEAIVIGYAMSRLDHLYLKSRQSTSWKSAFAEAANALSVRPASIKNLRDEFDPIHPNSRKGWHNRALRKNRHRVLGELCDISDDGLLELVGRIIQRDEEPIIEAIDSLANVTKVVYNVAERLLTGRRAEEYFLDHSNDLIDVPRADLEDL